MKYAAVRFSWKYLMGDKVCSMSDCDNNFDIKVDDIYQSAGVMGIHALKRTEAQQAFLSLHFTGDGVGVVARQCC